MKRPTASSSHPPNSTVAQQSGSAAQTQSSSHANAAISSPTAPPVVTNTTSSTSLCATINYPTRWTRFWLFLVRPPIPDFSSLPTAVSTSAASYPTPSKHKTPEVSISALHFI
ncbi:hypothetical protein CY34DRAFT_19705 [Suillus luteus UH-Slu-Lm8-n1]|uniref:Uncharacterized protein n=1 Tax=Suillus luteus UH-Slu-Lm8-n1 TaxID=930992 RepID=A0A0C9Z2G5_9AGAM|nr:hypothetical protein CY34DRAFT_19705 [Suillus luteus UH-Slu-Lm8-n1]